MAKKTAKKKTIYLPKVTISPDRRATYESAVLTWEDDTITLSAWVRKACDAQAKRDLRQ